MVMVVGPRGRQVQQARMSTQPERQVVAVVRAGVGAGGVWVVRAGRGAGDAAGRRGQCSGGAGVGVGHAGAVVVRVVPNYVRAGGARRLGGWMGVMVVMPGWR